MSDLQDGTKNLEERLMAALRITADSVSAELEGEMKKNAPWTNRTGTARRSLTVHPEFTDRYLIIVLALGVDYGIYLEKAHEQKYAIIKPTILKNKNKVMEEFRNLIYGKGNK